MPYDNVARKHYDSGDYPRALAHGARQARRREMARAPEAGRARRPHHRHRLRELLRAVRARHQRVRRLGPADDAGLRPGGGAAHAGRRPRSARRRAFARPGHGNHAGAARAPGARHRRRARPGGARRYRHHAVLHRHLCLALDRHVGRRGGERLQGAHPAHRARSARTSCSAPAGRVRFENGAVVGPGGKRHARRHRARPGTCAPSALPPDVDRSGLEAIGRLQAQARHRRLQLRLACGGGRRRHRTPARSRSSTTWWSRTAARSSIPMVVEGQTIGGIAQGIGTAIYEEQQYDANGQPNASTLRRLPDARPDRDPEHPHLPSGIAVALHRVRHQGHGRGRRHRAAGGDLQRGQRRARPARRRGARDAAHAARSCSRRSSGARPCRSGRRREGRRVRLRRGRAMSARRSPLSRGDGREADRRRPVARADAEPAPRAAEAAGRRVAHRRRCSTIEDEGDAWRIGAAVTHAELEDRRARGLRAARQRRRAASPIARCAIAARSAAAWPTPIRRPTGRSCCAALDATVRVIGRRRRRARSRPTVHDGAPSPRSLRDDEIIESIRVPKLGAGARWGYYKFCRKTGRIPGSERGAAARSAAARRAALRRRARQTAAAARCRGARRRPATARADRRMP